MEYIETRVKSLEEGRTNQTAKLREVDSDIRALQAQVRKLFAQQDQPKGPTTETKPYSIGYVEPPLGSKGLVTTVTIKCPGCNDFNRFHIHELTRRVRMEGPNVVQIVLQGQCRGKGCHRWLNWTV